jgi:glycosyltransferase involved in cell wall biosynthesis
VGSVVPINDAEAMACAVEKLLALRADDRQHLAMRLRERIMSHFSTTRLAERTASILESVAAGNPIGTDLFPNV